jgi:hypothetical protein
MNILPLVAGAAVGLAAGESLLVPALNAGPHPHLNASACARLGSSHWRKSLFPPHTHLARLLG